MQLDEIKVNKKASVRANDDRLNALCRFIQLKDFLLYWSTWIGANPYIYHPRVFALDSFSGTVCLERVVTCHDRELSREIKWINLIFIYDEVP